MIGASGSATAGGKTIQLRALGAPPLVLPLVCGD
jgi:hypothetical protein